jgi:hypothetical protein
MGGPSRTRAWIILLALAGGLLVFQLIERSKSWTGRAKAARLGAELLASQTPEQAEAIARELGAFQEAAVEPLVAGLISEEPLIAEAAADEIARRLAAWRQLPRKESSPKVAVLVRELAWQRDAIPPEHLRRVRDWAEAILLWPLKGRNVDAGAVLTDCQALLEMPQPDEEQLTERLAQLQSQKPVAEQSPMIELPPPLEYPMPEETADLPPIVSPADVIPADPPLAEPDAIDDSTELPLHPREPRGIYVPRARPIKDALPEIVPEATRPREPALLPPIKATATELDLESLSEIEVMNELHGEDPAETAAAEQELARRGYKPAHVSLARQLTDADPAVRWKLVQALPRTRGIDPRPWLLHLSEDADEKVRTAARNLLKTSQDPDLLQKLR